MISERSAANNSQRAPDSAPSNSFPIDPSVKLISSTPTAPIQPHHELHLDALKSFSRERGTKLPSERQSYLIEQTLPAIKELLTEGINANNLQILQSNLPLLKSHLKFTLDELDKNLQKDPDSFQDIDVSALAHYGASLQIAIKILGTPATTAQPTLPQVDLIERSLKAELIAIKKFLEKTSSSDDEPKLALPR